VGTPLSARTSLSHAAHHGSKAATGNLKISVTSGLVARVSQLLHPCAATPMGCKAAHPTA